MSKMQDGGPRKRGVPSPSDQRRKTGITEPSGSLPNSFRSRVLACAPCLVRSFSGPLSLSLSLSARLLKCVLLSRSGSVCHAIILFSLSLSLSHSFICALISLPRTPSFQRAFSPLSTRAARGSSGRRWRPGMPCGRRRGRGRGGWRWRRRFFWTTTRTGAA